LTDVTVSTTGLLLDRIEIITISSLQRLEFST